MKCKLCGGGNVVNFLERKNVPFMQNLIVKTESAARGVARGDLFICYCAGCDFVFNGAFDPDLTFYGGEYDNNQTHSNCFNDYIGDIIDRLTGVGGVNNSFVVEVGCGKGDFIKKLIGGGGGAAGCRGMGFDTTYEGDLSFFDGALKFKKKYFSKENVDFTPDVIVCRHVIEHIEKPVEFLKSIKEAAGCGPALRYFFETPRIEWILEKKVIFDFFYEHCSYFSETSIGNAFESAGIAVDKIRAVFEEQYMWVEASSKPDKFKNGPEKIRRNMNVLIEEYRAAEFSFRRKCEDLLCGLSAGGAKTAVWGAGAKGVTFLNLIDPGKELIEYVIDINANKQGNYIPGSAQLIIDFKKIPYYNIQNIILMNPNYRPEIQKTLDEQNIKAKIIDITEYLKK
ncbi:MAG TPA: methyltransferase [Candidatus Wallbacteria bacterium]|nr:methyltransferase [Candidatus Wallbacteria bacterium]